MGTVVQKGVEPSDSFYVMFLLASHRGICLSKRGGGGTSGRPRAAW